MVVTLLGTGTSSGVPLIGCECEVCSSLDFRDNRLRTSALVEVSGKTFLIDAGPDFRQQMLRHKVRQLDAILVTHAHKDHIAGLDDVRAFNFLLQKPMPVYATNEVLEQIKTEFHYVFEEHKYPGIPQMDLHSIDNQLFEVEGVKITPIEVWHAKMKVMGFRFNNFAYITDVNLIPEAEFDKLQNLDVLVLDALQQDSHPSHFTLDEAVETALKIRAKQTYLVHASHKMGLHSVVEKRLPEGVKLAFDGLKICL